MIHLSKKKMRTRVRNVESNLQPVTCVGREERAAEHQDAPQNIFLGHLERGREERSVRDELIPRWSAGSAVGKEAAAGSGEGC